MATLLAEPLYWSAGAVAGVVEGLSRTLKKTAPAAISSPIKAANQVLFGSGPAAPAAPGTPPAPALLATSVHAAAATTPAPVRPASPPSPPLAAEEDVAITATVDEEEDWADAASSVAGSGASTPLAGVADATQRRLEF